MLTISSDLGTAHITLAGVTGAELGREFDDVVALYAEHFEDQKLHEAMTAVLEEGYVIVVNMIILRGQDGQSQSKIDFIRGRIEE